ncbi:hypothetical protein ACFZBC_16070 [Streptomyces luteogriseus]|uniref:hypothetical protein n=1 Tax=Streptomyces luteogriseus TaxID=68233 RepID=UPI0036F18153
MRRPSDLVGTAARTLRRSRVALVTAVVTTVGLAGCGTERAGTGVGVNGPAGSAEGRPGTALSKTLNEVARTCPADGPPQAPPAGPANSVPPGTGETPPSGAVVPIAPTAGPEMELNARDRYAGHLHAERVARTPWDLKTPTPTGVRAVLSDLGYLDERVHGLRWSGAATRLPGSPSICATAADGSAATAPQPVPGRSWTCA